MCIDTYVQPVVHERVGLCFKGRLTAVWELLQLGLQLSANSPHLLYTLLQSTQLLLNISDLHKHTHVNIQYTGTHRD